MKKISAIDQAALEKAWKEKFSGKKIEPFSVGGMIVNFQLGGEWPIGIFSEGFLSGIEYQKKKAKRKTK